MAGPTRRGFIAGLGAASLAGMAPGLGAVEIGGGAPATSAASADPASGFLMEPGLIHFNTGTTGASPRAVVEATLDATRRFESNPPFQAYRASGDTLLVEAETARARCAACVHCTPDELLLTHGTTDAMNSVAAAIELKPGDRVLTSSMEHDGGVLCWHWLGPKRGVIVDVVALPPEEIDDDSIVARFEAAITSRTRVLSVSHVLAWTGLVMPIAKLCAMARRHGLLTVIDGAQAVGQLPLDMGALGCDAYAGSGHKWLLGPKGTGLLYVRADPAERIRPLAWASGKHRLNVDSMGICPLPLVIGLAAAVARLDGDGLSAVAAHNLPLRNRLYDELGRLPGAQRVGPPPGGQVCGLATIRLPDARDCDALRTVLASKYRILVRSVSKTAFNGLRVSAHVYNDDAQADTLMAALRAELV